MVSTQLAYSSFSVSDLAAARAFYADILGIDVATFEEGLALRLESGTNVFVYPKENHAPATFTVLHIPVADLEATVDDLVAKGVKFERYDGFNQDERGIAKMDEGSGPRLAWCTDPSGNVIGLAAGMEDMLNAVAGA